MTAGTETKAKAAPRLSRMRCGGCGCGTFTLRKAPRGDIVVRCRECGSASIITVKPAELTVEWTDEATGRLTVMGPEDGP